MNQTIGANKWLQLLIWTLFIHLALASKSSSSKNFLPIMLDLPSEDSETEDCDSSDSDSSQTPIGQNMAMQLVQENSNSANSFRPTSIEPKSIPNPVASGKTNDLSIEWIDHNLKERRLNLKNKFHLNSKLSSSGIVLDHPTSLTSSGQDNELEHQLKPEVGVYSQTIQMPEEPSKLAVNLFQQKLSHMRSSELQEVVQTLRTILVPRLLRNTSETELKQEFSFEQEPDRYRVSSGGSKIESSSRMGDGHRPEMIARQEIVESSKLGPHQPLAVRYLGFGQLERDFNSGDVKLTCDLSDPKSRNESISAVQWVRISGSFDAASGAFECGLRRPGCQLSPVTNDAWTTIHPRPQLQFQSVAGQKAPSYSLSLHQVDSTNRDIFRCSALRVQETGPTELVYRLIPLEGGAWS